MVNLAFVLAILGGASVRAESPQDSRELFQQLNNVSLDPTRIYTLRDAQITRDRVKIYFNRGFIGFFSEVAGETTGAVFTGSGEILLVPPNPVEKGSLARFTKSPILEEQFTSLYMRFTDGTAQELLAQARKPDPEDLEQPTGFAEDWSPVIRRLNPDYSARILENLAGDRNFPYFHARIQGVSLGVFVVTDDERLPEAISISAARRSEGKLVSDIWCSFSSRTSQARSQELAVGSARVLSYKIDTRISTDRSLEGHADLELESRSSANRVLVFQLSRLLKISEVKDEQGESLAVFQNPALEESEVAARGDDWIMVVLPIPHSVGQRFRLNFVYQGNVIAEVGNGVLYVGARGSWYPNRGRSTRATYDLTFHYPESLTLVATGSPAMENSSEGWKHSRWISDGPFPLAGFNLGAYVSTVRRLANTKIEVYATHEAEALLEKRHAALHPGGSVTSAARPLGPLIARPLDRSKLPMVVLPEAVAPLAPAAALGSVAENAARAVQYFETLFGPFPYPRLALSQIPGNFGQGWPELVYLPTLSFLSATERYELGGGGRIAELSEQSFVAHEVAHQWWGNQLGWKTYHDQWLSEGLASYAAALYLAREKDGERKLHDLLRSYKRDLMSKTKEGNTVESGGAIWLGQRLSNSLNPLGYNDMVYKKACWVLHMLRTLMADPKSGSDERFFKMLRDFVVAQRNGDPLTEDFVRHAEKYMPQAIDLEHNKRLDWFFNEWVYATGIPTYKLKTVTRPLDSKKFIIEGTIEQSEVPAEFEMPVPVVAVYGRERKVKLGRVTVGEAGGRFRFTVAAKPSRVTVDEDAVLAVVR